MDSAERDQRERRQEPKRKDMLATFIFVCSLHGVIKYRKQLRRFVSLRG